MAKAGYVHWHEGLFLRQHHLQVMQKAVVDQFAAERRLSWRFPYGLIEARISGDELENMRVAFDRLIAVMPGGLIIHAPDNTDISALNIKEAFASTTGPLEVSLGVPLWYTMRANVVEGQGAYQKRTYRVDEIECADENTGDNPQSIPIRRINARLLLPGDDRSDMEVMPVLRIVHAAGEDVGFPRQDTNYAPPCLVITGSPVLRELLRDLASQVMASRNELNLQIAHGGVTVVTMQGMQMEQFLRLRTLNRFAVRLAGLLEAAHAVGPFDAFCELRELLAELSALRPDNDQFEIIPYNHDDVLPGFTSLSRSIRSLLKGTVQAKVLKAAFAPEERTRILVAHLDEQAVTVPNEYFLGIRTKQDPKTVIELVMDRDRFKMMPLSLKQQLIFGIKLTHERVPPVELPAQVGLHYFRLNPDENKRIWERILQEKGIALRWPGYESSDFEATLYMTVPVFGEKK